MNRGESRRAVSSPKTKGSRIYKTATTSLAASKAPNGFETVIPPPDIRGLIMVPVMDGSFPNLNQRK
jgi:hypothetical protein